MFESYLYKKLERKSVQCQTCAHYCMMAPEEFGKCGVRKNEDGVLSVLNYGKVGAISIDPIEKKPFFHYMPGSQSLSFGAPGCNLTCKNCLNWQLTQGPKITKIVQGEEYSPTQIINLAKRYQLPSISYTYSEPTIFLEFALDTMKLARAAGIRNLWVGNGFMSKEAREKALPYLDAINIDIKTFSEKTYNELCGAHLQPILATAKFFKKNGVWVEITTLAIPGVSDDQKTFIDIAKFINSELGPDTPWHISRFYPEISWQLRNIGDTNIKNIENGVGIGKSYGLYFVYSGNVPGIDSEDTYCFKCHHRMIDRQGYNSIQRLDNHGYCSYCGENLSIIN